MHVVWLVNGQRARTLSGRGVHPSRLQPVASREAGKSALLLLDREAQIPCSCISRHPPCTVRAQTTWTLSNVKVRMVILPRSKSPIRLL